VSEARLLLALVLSWTAVVLVVLRAIGVLS